MCSCAVNLYHFKFDIALHVLLSFSLTKVTWYKIISVLAQLATYRKTILERKKNKK